VIKDGTHDYYLLKVERRGFNVFCYFPHLGRHITRHDSGESHIRFEKQKKKFDKVPPIMLQMGEAGLITDKGIVCATLRDLGRASAICTAHFPIDSLINDYQEFNRQGVEFFLIEKDLFPMDVRGIEVGVWAVPDRNKDSFEYNNPNIPKDFLYKVIRCEPQIWLYARPSILFT
jgi:hypothetical protein